MRRERVCWVLPLLLAASGTAWADTDVRVYGYADVSVDEVDNGLRTASFVSSNLSYIGFAAQHDVTTDIKVVAQVEGEAEITSSPNLKGTFGARNSFLGFASKAWGSVKVGKNDTPYKTATASFDPFSATIGDYNIIMGNTGGDGRVEFDLRANHAIWYESPSIGGLIFSLMWSPSQNAAGDSSNFPLGDNVCAGSTNGGNASGNAGVQNTFGGTSRPSLTGGATIGTGFAECTDGAFGDLYSTSLVYKRAGFTGIAATELHHAVNRVSDNTPGGGGTMNMFGNNFVDQATEWAAKLGAGYDFGNGLRLYSIGEYMRRTQVQTGFNERTRWGMYFSASYRFTEKDDVNVAYAHAFKTSGSPGVPQFNQTCPGGDNTQDNQVDQISLGLKHYFSPSVTAYAVAALTHNHQCAHYGLGVGGHGNVYLQRNQFNETFPGKDLAGISAGATFKF